MIINYNNNNNNYINNKEITTKKNIINRNNKLIIFRIISKSRSLFLNKKSGKIISLHIDPNDPYSHFLHKAEYCLTIA